MNLRIKNKYWLATLGVLAITLQGCEDKSAATASSTTDQFSKPITVTHELGTAVIDHRPQRVAALDMNEVDFLDQLEIPIAGMVKDYVPHYLKQYKNDTSIKDLGAIVQPNIERVHTLKPDLILMTPLHAANYQELADIAPTLHFDDSIKNHITKVEEHLTTLGQIFGKEELAEKKVEQLQSKVKQVQQLASSRPEKALVVLHNNGAFRNLGPNSRYGFVFEELGVKTASKVAEASLHGQPISSEFIQQADPDILYIVDRTAVMERRSTINYDDVSNPLLRQTKAWKTNHVVFVDADAWYIAASSPTAINIMLDDITKGYKTE
ncbi:ABC transporter substrate-binding protein [Marinomonas mediterranea]|uniref:ABC-type transporter, periplasmic subunit n=1 Tax=Marinomonas mediterranea (strain ATCC 700492 / JCM 21426 / NBRC 103028 / MMB-1) TaxID=717774 RepID=F2JYE5_MARM1|nr:siderophore ABC transporter substrate-binding protein [Marinomonas mediterranea]ADZ91976.1 ABC-type transporter, periplasmic subunit [Marinomonas mediterranea MMB-1]WCN14008.1 ABC transporter substrate-binding protein [Marinomonas mediterranea]WCN18055.1 ABC transporter substrate-binding protein [Marinomonas mediterranea MMB-1]